MALLTSLPTHGGQLHRRPVLGAPVTSRLLGAAFGDKAERASFELPRSRAVLWSGASCVSCLALLRRRQLRVQRPPRRAQAAAVLSTEDKPAETAWCQVAKVVEDIAIVITSPRGQEDSNTTPEVGATVQFSSGSVAYVVAVGDLCFAAALRSRSDIVEEGESYKIMPTAIKPTIRIPEAGYHLVDLKGQDLLSPSGTQGSLDSASDEADENTVPWFQEMTGIIERTRIDSALHAGVMSLDAFVPIGRGQSMLLRLPGMSQENFQEYLAHMVKAQEGSDVRTFMAQGSAEEAQRLQQLVGKAEAGTQLTIVSGRSESASPGEAVLALNAACALAEVCRDDGGNALLLVDLEPMYKVWTALEEVSVEMQLATRAESKDVKTKTRRIDSALGDTLGLGEDVGADLWKYVAGKNARTARRRTFLGCFLQRAGRMSKDRGGGSLTLLAFVRSKAEDQLSKKELEAKMRNLETMNLDEAVRARALEKLSKEISLLGKDGFAAGVPDDFTEEAKAVTDGHVVLGKDSIGEDGSLHWCVDLKESVARGITAFSVQNRYLDTLKSLRLKAYLMNAETKSEVIKDTYLGELDNGPLMALMQQPVGDMLRQEDEAALLVLAQEAASRAAASRPLALKVMQLLKSARIKSDSAEGTRKRAACLKIWAEACWREDADVDELIVKGSEALADALQLRPLERKRLLAAVAEEQLPANAEELAGGSENLLAEDATTRYAALRSQLNAVEEALPRDLDISDADDEEASMFCEILRARILSKLDVISQ